VRSGLTQDGRRRAELGDRYFLPDERDLADLILFGQRFAKHVQYYDATNTKAGDWTVFFESDVTASLAALTKLPVDAFRASRSISRTGCARCPPATRMNYRRISSSLSIFPFCCCRSPAHTRRGCPAIILSLRH
jgi:hypothetical protein